MDAMQDDVHRAWQLLMRFFFARREPLPAWGGEFDLSPVQCHVLHLLEPGRPMPMNRLAAALSCDASNVTGLVDRLESRGVVERQPSTAARPRKVLELTPTGARLRSDLLRCMTRQPHPLSRLSAREHRMLVKIL